MSKPKKIILVVPSKKMEREFSPDHAERLLNMENNGGWQLKTNVDSSRNKRKAGKTDKEVRN